MFVVVLSVRRLYLRAVSEHQLAIRACLATHIPCLVSLSLDLIADGMHMEQTAMKPTWRGPESC